jgi:hypothetical protein
VAQSLINSSKVQAQIRQIQQLDAGIATFKDKFRGLPGDSSRINGIGNNDGIISNSANPIYSSEPVFMLEVKYVWPDLQASGMFNGYVFGAIDYCGSYPTPCDFTPPNLHIIPAEINDKTGIMVAMDNNWYVTGFNGYTFSSYETGMVDDSARTVACTDALAIDTKIDNALTNSGNVWANECDSGAQEAYLTGADNVSIMFIKILSQTGGGN